MGGRKTAGLSSSLLPPLKLVSPSLLISSLKLKQSDATRQGRQFSLSCYYGEQQLVRRNIKRAFFFFSPLYKLTRNQEALV